MSDYIDKDGVKHFQALRDLHIKREEGLNPDNIDKAIEVLLEIPKEEFGGSISELSKLELLDLYYKARTVFRESKSTTKIWFQINCYMETDNKLDLQEWELIRD